MDSKLDDGKHICVAPGQSPNREIEITHWDLVRGWYLQDISDTLTHYFPKYEVFLSLDTKMRHC